MVGPEDFIDKKGENDLDRAILRDLHTLRNCAPFSAHEIAYALLNKYICKNLHVFILPKGVEHLCPTCHEKAQRLLNQDQDHAERTVRNHLASLCYQGDLQKTTRKSTGDPGRAPEVYHLSDAFRIALDDFLNKKEMQLGSPIVTAIRCNDPMKCPDIGCKLCTKAGIRTKWD